MATKEPVPIPYQLAKISWIAPIIVFVVNYVLRNMAGPPGEGASRAVIYTILGVSFYLIGLISGVAALFGIPKYGRKGILVPSLFGILFNSLLLFVIAVIFLGVLNRQ